MDAYSVLKGIPGMAKRVWANPKQKSSLLDFVNEQTGLGITTKDYLSKADREKQDTLSKPPPATAVSA